VQKLDACGSLGLSSIQKCTAVLHMLAYGVTIDATDKYCSINKSTVMESMKRFCQAVPAEFRPHYLRQPMWKDFEAQLRINSMRHVAFQICLRHLTACIMCGKTAPLRGRAIMETKMVPSSSFKGDILLIKVFISSMFSSICPGQITTSMY